MRISETPARCADLDLMKALLSYANGEASWRSDSDIGVVEKAECMRLHSALISTVERQFSPLLDRVTSREMKTFTMHDSKHGLKVAHLMWNILSEARRERLTPPEIALMILSAHLHDLGMGILDDVERKARLSPDSDLWAKADAVGSYARTLDILEARLLSGAIPPEDRPLAFQQVAEAQDALLCIDSRERHATPGRYKEILESLKAAHTSHTRIIPSIEEAMRFGEDSFEASLIEVCVSHNEDAGALLSGRPERKSKPRFPQNYPVGTSFCDLKLVAATLRLADILDFDRERVPPILYHYLLPRSAKPAENISVREWQKHMAISNWEFSEERVSFHGRSSNPVAHHAVVEFCKAIEAEIARTRAVFRDGDWPFQIGDRVVCELHSEGFTYLPYRFELNEQKIFNLLMGRALYKDPIVSIRELLQNSVDACRLRDALIQAHRPSIKPSSVDRISISYYEEGTDGSVPRIAVQDSGTGMDRWLIENYLLKVGDSYYTSPDFLRTNAILWKKDAGFVPVSEFGIGFLSCFMLATQIQVETAMPSSPRGDFTRRVLNIDGIGHLISVSEFPNEGYDAFEGTRVVLALQASEREREPLDWQRLQSYVRSTCIDLPYSLLLQHFDCTGSLVERIEITPRGQALDIPAELEKGALRIHVGSPSEIAEGEIALFSLTHVDNFQKDARAERQFIVSEDHERMSYSGVHTSALSRGGFSVGEVPGLPSYVGFRTAATGLLKLNGRSEAGSKYLQTTLSRSGLIEGGREIQSLVLRAWLEPLIKDPSLVSHLSFGVFSLGRTARIALLEAAWLENYSAFDLYQVARAFVLNLQNGKKDGTLVRWEHHNEGQVGLGIFADYLHRVLFELILPPVCKLRVGDQKSLYVAPPVDGWEARLRATHTFISNPVRWSRFAEYVGAIDSLLYYEYTNNDWMSDRYESAFSNVSDEDLTQMRSVFSKLATGAKYGYVVQLTPYEEKLLQVSASLAPDGKIGAIGVSGIPLSAFVK